MMSSRGEDRPGPHLLLATDLVSRIAAEYNYLCQIRAWIWEIFCDFGSHRPLTLRCFPFQPIDGQARYILLSFHCVEFLERDVDNVRSCDVMYMRDTDSTNSGNLALPGTQLDSDRTRTSSRPVRNRKALQDYVLQPPHLFVHPMVFYNLCGRCYNFRRLAEWMVDITKEFAKTAVFTPEEFDIYDMDHARHRLTFDIYRLRYVDKDFQMLTHLDVVFMEDQYSLVQRLPLRKTVIVSRSGVSSDQAEGPR